MEWQDVRRRIDEGEERHTELKTELQELYNESLAHFMAGMGFMERRGRGWLIMRREMQAFNGTEPELLHDEPNQFVRVTFLLDPQT